jgi:hypothetical protein
VSSSVDIGFSLARGRNDELTPAARTHDFFQGAEFEEFSANLPPVRNLISSKAVFTCESESRPI